MEGSRPAPQPSPLLPPILRHPLLLAGSGDGTAAKHIQPNDLELGGDKPGALLLTGGASKTGDMYHLIACILSTKLPHTHTPPGANTSGKSTLLRAACLAVICAQVGCHVPAAAALLAPCDGGERALQTGRCKTAGAPVNPPPPLPVPVISHASPPTKQPQPQPQPANRTPNP